MRAMRRELPAKVYQRFMGFAYIEDPPALEAKYRKAMVWIEREFEELDQVIDQLEF